MLGELGPARAALERSLELSPEQSSTAFWLCLELLLEKKPAEALAAAHRSTSETFRLAGEAMAHHHLGHEEEVRRLLAEMSAKYAIYQIAEVQAWLGDNDQAFASLERARVQHDAGLIYTKGDPALRGLHGDPRWRALLEALHLPVD